MDKTEQEHLKSWKGRQQSINDEIAVNRAQALAMTLDTDADCIKDEEPLPPLWHWIYFWQPVFSSETGPDGHPKKGGFLPPVNLPNRMWAGGSLTFLKPLRLGRRIEKISTIHEIEFKNGRTGPLVFVTVRHDYYDAGDLLLSELQDIVYREPVQVSKNSEPPAPEEWVIQSGWKQRIVPTTLLLFRYSALTFNGHRIHYDRDYVTNVENYPGLVFHGPLTATLLAELVRKNLPDKKLATFSYRAERPLFDTEPFTVEGILSADSCSLRAVDPQGFRATSAEAKFE